VLRLAKPLSKDSRINDAILGSHISDFRHMMYRMTKSRDKNRPCMAGLKYKSGPVPRPLVPSLCSQQLPIMLLKVTSERPTQLNSSHLAAGLSCLHIQSALDGHSEHIKNCLKLVVTQFAVIDQ